MDREREQDSRVEVEGAPTIPQLGFRRFQGKADYPAMLAVIQACKEADGIERTDSVEDVARNYENLVNCDPYTDTLFAEVGGEVIGYGRAWWEENQLGERLYKHFAFLEPAWRGKGVRRAMLRHNEHRLGEIAAGHDGEATKLLESWAADTETHWSSLLESAGYQAVRYEFVMVRPDLEGIPDPPLPAGLEVRPAPPEGYRAVWECAREAFRDEWCYVDAEWTNGAFEAWLQERTFDPSLWQVAWDGDQVAGIVLNFIDAEENREYGRRRGYTEGIAIRRPWRRQGLARALIARSFRALRERGMVEAALSVDAENPSGALRLYTSMGFRVTKRFATYRKPMNGLGGAEWWAGPVESALWETQCAPCETYVREA